MRTPFFPALLAMGHCLLSTAHSETISIVQVPAKLPPGQMLNTYSPPVGVAYAGLNAGENYTLIGWLLTPGPWYCASTQWCQRSSTVTNAFGTNSQGVVWFTVDMDVFNYSTFDWVFRLYDTNGNQVAWTEQYIDPTTNQPPVLAAIGNRTGVTGQTLNFTLSATDPEGTQIHFGAMNSPPGATLNAASGVFAWTPTNVGSFGPVIFWAEDSGDGTLRDGESVIFTITSAPNIIVQPQSQVTTPGSNVSFSVQATSDTPMTYQWRFNGTNLGGATTTSLVLTNVSTSKAGGYSVMIQNTAGSTLSSDAVLTVVLPRTPLDSVALSLTELDSLMDEYHQSFQVYTDISAGGNHFHARGQLPDQNSAVGISGSYTNNPHSGATCSQCTFTNLGNNNNGGFYFLNGILYGTAPLPYFGESNVVGTPLIITNFTGYDLSAAQRLKFWAQGQSGGEKIEFFVGGVGRDPFSGSATQPFPDSMPRHPAAGTTFLLTTNWQQFTIDLSGQNLTNIMGGFGWFAEATKNPAGATFYLDDIVYELSPTGQVQRLNQPRFIRSFRTRPVQPNIFDANQDDDLDFVLREVAFTYDNALAVAAFLEDGAPDSLRRAKLIGDSFVLAATRDRTYSDGRFRTAYASGDIALPPGWLVNGKASTVSVPGFYLENPPRFFEVENADIDTGNNAWAMIALLALHKQFGGTKYLNAARNVGQFLQTMISNTGSYPGFRGGIQTAETANPVLRTYASTEHNLDAYAAFSQMFALTGETQWLTGASLALGFVELMWNPQSGCYLTGTTGGSPDGRNQSPWQLPLDTQSWNVLAVRDVLTRHPHLLDCAEQHHRNQHDGFDGFDFNNDRDGVWFEGTAQMAVAYSFAAVDSRVDQLRAVLQAGQQIPPPFGDGLGMPAASHDGVTSGFSFKLFLRPHVGATAWNIFAQLGFDPYYQSFSPVRVVFLGFDTGRHPQLRIIGEPGKSHALQKSLDLVHWTAIGTNSSAIGKIDFVDLSAPTNRIGFYRGVFLSGGP